MKFSAFPKILKEIVIFEEKIFRLTIQIVDYRDLWLKQQKE